MLPHWRSDNRVFGQKAVRTRKPRQDLTEIWFNSVFLICDASTIPFDNTLELAASVKGSIGICRSTASRAVNIVSYSTMGERSLWTFLFGVQLDFTINRKNITYFLMKSY